MSQAARATENIRFFPAKGGGGSSGGSSSGGSSSGARAHAYAHERPNAAAIQKAANHNHFMEQQYRYCIGEDMPQWVKDNMGMYSERVPFEYIIYALAEAAMAPRPSWRYAVAIIKRLEREAVDPQTLPMSIFHGAMWGDEQ